VVNSYRRRIVEVIDRMMETYADCLDDGTEVLPEWAQNAVKVVMFIPFAITAIPLFLVGVAVRWWK
jgi:hypothetical protein